MAISVDRIHQQYHKQNVADFDFDVVEESKEFQKLSLTDNMPPDQPQVPKKVVDDGGKQLEQKPVAAREESKEFKKLSLTDVPQFPKKESKEFQKLSMTDNMPPQPQVPKSGKPLEQKPAVDFLYHDITTPFAPNTYSPSLGYYNSLRKPEWMRHEKPSSASTYSPSSPDFHYVLPTYEEHVALKSFEAPIFFAPLISNK